MGNAQATQRESKLTSFPQVTCKECERGEKSVMFCECEEMLLEELFSDSEKKENEKELKEICRDRRKELKTLYEMKEEMKEVPNGDETIACLMELISIEDEILEVQNSLYEEDEVENGLSITFIMQRILGFEGTRSPLLNGVVATGVHGVGGFGRVGGIHSQLREERREPPRPRPAIARQQPQRTISLRKRIEHVKRLTTGRLQSEIQQLTIVREELQQNLTDEKNRSNRLEATITQLNAVIRALREDVQTQQAENANNRNRLQLLQTMNANLDNANRRLTNQLNQQNNAFRPRPVVIHVAGREPYERTIQELPRSPSP